MKKVIIVPVSEIERFPGMAVVARGGAIAALIGESLHQRSRSAYDSDEEFFKAVASGRADLNTFETVEFARAFAEDRIEFLNEKAHRIEEAVSRITAFAAKKPAVATKIVTKVSESCRVDTRVDPMAEPSLVFPHAASV